MSITTETYLEPTRIITGWEEPFDNICIDPRETMGMVIVGMGQAGKSTLRDCISESWLQKFHPEGEVFHFSNSNGFRGLTAHAIAELGYDPDVPLDDTTEFIEAINARYDLSDRWELLDSFYDNPAGDATLRSKAADKAVPYVSESVHIRPHINAAGSRFIERVLGSPEKAGLKARPGLIIIDGRNQEECIGKFLSAGVRPLGTLVLTCPEDIAVTRMPKVAKEDRPKEAARLKARNDEDRNRVLGRMTTPEDLRQAFVLHELVSPGHKAVRRLLNAGAAIAADLEAGAVVDTQRLTLEAEQSAVELVMWGALKQAELSVNKAA